MTDRTARVILTADPAGLEAGMARAAAATDVASKAMGDSVDASTTRVGGLFGKLSNTMSNMGIPGAAAFDKIGSKIGETDTKGQKFMQTMSTLGGVTLAAGAVGFAAVAAESVKMASSFQSASEHLVTDAGESQKALGMVQAGMLSISAATGTASSDIVNGMYHIESAGFHGAAGLDLLKAAAEGAKVGGADLDTVAKTLTGTMRAYNIPASQAVAVMNQLITTVGQGDMRMQDLASSLGNVAPVAAAAHISIAQVGGAIATMTAQNMSAQQATQDLANIIRGLQAPNAVAINEMAQFGINSQTVAEQLGQKGLTGTITELTQAILSKMGPTGTVMLNTFNQSIGAAQDMQAELKAMPPDVQNLANAFTSGKLSVQDYRKAIKALPADEQALAQGFVSTYTTAHKFNSLLTSGAPGAQTYTQALAKMTGGATGLNTALMLSGGNADSFSRSVLAIADAGKKGGDTVDNWNKIQATFSQQMDVAKTSVQDLAIRFGMYLIPKLDEAIHAVSDTISWFQQHKVVAEALAVTIGTVLAGAVATFAVNTAVGMVNSVKSALTSIGLLSATEDTTAASTDALTAAMTSLEVQLAALTAPTETAATAQEAVNVAWEAAEGLATELDADLTTLAAAYERVGVAAQTAGVETQVAGGEMATAGAEAGEAGMAGGLAAGEGAATGLSGVLGPLGLAVGGVTLGAVALNHVIMSQAVPAFESMTKSADAMSANSLPQLTLKIDAAEKAQEAASKAMRDGGLTGLAAQANYKVLQEGIEALRAEQTQMTNNLTILSAAFGINKSQALDVASALGVNLKSALDPAQVTAFGQQVQQMGLNMDATGGKAQTMSSNTVAAMSSMSSQINQVMNSTEWVAIGDSISNGVAAGIVASMGAPIGAAENMAAAALTAAHHAIDNPPYPSQRFRDEIGASIAEGVAAGIMDKAPSVSSAMNALLGAGSGSLPPASYAVAAGGSSAPVTPGGIGNQPLILNIDGQTFARLILPSLQTQASLYQRTVPLPVFGNANA